MAPRRLITLHQNRLEKASKLLRNWDVSALLIEDPIDIYYFTGKKMSFGKLILEENGGILYTDARYYAAIAKNLPVALKLYKKQEFLSDLGKKRRVGFDAEKASYADYERWKQATKDLLPICSPLRDLRAIKDASEIAAIKRACHLTKQGCHLLQKHAKTGISEKSLARSFEEYIVKEGAVAPSFPPNVSFGANAAHPHHHPSDTPLPENSPILVDIGANVAGYCADMTRVFFHGTPCKETVRIYRLVQDAYHKAASYCKEGALASDLDQAAREELAKSSMSEFFTHSLGHGVGLEIHEYPSIRPKGDLEDPILLAGMVITIEPGIYLSGNIGARYENTLLVTKHGHENLLAS